jgi:cation diffusion facilitator family transporter
VTDSASLGLAALAAWLARKPPSSRHSYGFGRAEIVAALMNAVFMLAVIATIMVVAIQRLQDPQPVAGESVIVFAMLGLLVNILVAWLLARGETTMNTRGAVACDGRSARFDRRPFVWHRRLDHRLAAHRSSALTRDLRFDSRLERSLAA